MKKLILVILIFNSCFGFSQMSPCLRLDSLYRSGAQVKTFAFLQSNSNWPCEDENFKILKAKILTENYRFSEAKYVLSTLSSDKTQDLIRRIDFLEDVSSTRTGANVRESKYTAEGKNNLWLNIREICLIDTQFVLSEFPLTVWSQKAFFPTIESDSWLEKWLLLQNFQEVLPGASFSDSTGAVTVLVKKPFQKKSPSYDIAIVDLINQKLITTWSSSDDSNTMYPCFRDGAIIFSSDKRGGFGGFDLWSVEWDGSKFGTIKNLGPNINSAADEIYPAVGGGKLYFASNREDKSFGGFDLFEVAEGGEPKNMGLPINSNANDINPRMIDGKLHAIASDRQNLHYTLYEVNFLDTAEVFAELFGRVEVDKANLAGNYLVLTNKDSSIVKTAVLDKDGYFRLNQLKGLENYTVYIKGLDIPETGGRMTLWNGRGDRLVDAKMDNFGYFVFELLKPEDYFLEKEENMDESILSVDVKGFFENSTESEFVIALENSEGNVIGLTKTDEKGRFIFESVTPDDRYTIRTDVKNPNGVIRILNDKGKEIQVIHPEDQNGYVYLRLSEGDRVITITDESNRAVKISELETFDLPTVYFGSDQAELTAQSKQRLVGFINLVKKNPEINIEISGHTDSRGAEEYNLKLSQERIDSVLEYLIESGVSRERISGKGYGESRLKNECRDGISCSEEEHAENRRTELRIFQDPLQLEP